MVGARDLLRPDIAKLELGGPLTLEETQGLAGRGAGTAGQYTWNALLSRVAPCSPPSVPLRWLALGRQGSGLLVKLRCAGARSKI